MNRTSKTIGALACAAACVAIASPALGQKNAGSPGQVPARGANYDLNVKVAMMNADGKRLGTVDVRQVAHGVVLVAEVQGLSPGGHGFHIHQRGVCEPPDFKSAGEHYRPRGKTHGFDSPKGYHAGDLPNLHASASGEVRAEFHTMQVTLERPKRMEEKAGRGAPFSLADKDGSALIIHEKADDYQASTPESTGARIACGVIAVPR